MLEFPAGPVDGHCEMAGGGRTTYTLGFDGSALKILIICTYAVAKFVPAPAGIPLAGPYQLQYFASLVPSMIVMMSGCDAVVLVN